MSEDNLCATFFITKAQTGDKIIHSVHEQFKKHHKIIWEYLNNPYLRCKMRHMSNRNRYYDHCFVEDRGSFDGECLKLIDYQVDNGLFCDDSNYDQSRYLISDKMFDELDYYWAITNNFIERSRYQFLIRECQKKKGMLIGILGRDCVGDVDRYLRKKGAV
ncbi:hypothetical protein [Bauldia sp.]|uniref:hypothetical protein n=1 Tax=Bauldia sp. TaxID=2575872 RepID=UPI003BACFFB6